MPYKNKADRRAHAKEKYKNEKEVILAYQRTYKSENGTNKKYYEANRDLILEKKRTSRINKLRRKSTQFKKGSTIGSETRFKKGNVPSLLKEIGSVRLHRMKERSYYMIKTSDTKWEYLHRVMWEKTMGPIPENGMVQFKDKNSMNCEPSNLYIITRDKQMLENTMHRYGPEIVKLIRLCGKLNRKIREYEKQD